MVKNHWGKEAVSLLDGFKMPNFVAEWLITLIHMVDLTVCMNIIMYVCTCECAYTENLEGS